MKVFILFLMMVIGTGNLASAKTHCFCKVTTGDSNRQTTANGTVLKDYPIIAEWRTGIGHNKACKDLCKTASNPDIGSSQIATAACNANVAHDTNIRAYAAVGTDKYENVVDIGKVKRTSEQKGCAPNTGVLYNGKCILKNPVACPQGWEAKIVNNQVFCVKESDPIITSPATCGF